ncbi:hypothetical protein ACEQPO_02460 [Bacillus sp. SL00103]
MLRDTGIQLLLTKNEWLKKVSSVKPNSFVLMMDMKVFIKPELIPPAPKT